MLPFLHRLHQGSPLLGVGSLARSCGPACCYGSLRSPHFDGGGMRGSWAPAGSAPQRQRGKTFALLEHIVGEGVMLDRECYYRNSLHKYALYAVDDESTADSPAFPVSHYSWVRYPAPYEG